jgi:hypothetical protein
MIKMFSTEHDPTVAKGEGDTTQHKNKLLKCE